MQFARQAIVLALTGGHAQIQFEPIALGAHRERMQMSGRGDEVAEHGAAEHQPGDERVGWLTGHAKRDRQAGVDHDQDKDRASTSVARNW